MAAPNPRQSNFLIVKRGSSKAPSLNKDGSVPPPKRPPPSDRVTVVVAKPSGDAAQAGGSQPRAGEGTSNPPLLPVATRVSPAVCTNPTINVAP